MLTRLHIRGFKNLLDTEVRFGPFTCVAGRNGAGKSNIFAAIRFLNLLTEHPIMEAVALLRESTGRSPDPASLFTTFGEFRAPEISFEADLIVERRVTDDFGVVDESATSVVTYEVAFRLDNGNGVPRLELTRERLLPRTLQNARSSLGFRSTNEFRESCINGRRPVPFISTDESANVPEITVHQEGHGGRKLPAPKSSRTVVGGTTSSDFPTILAVRHEMQSWRTLMLEPSAMRSPSSYRDPSRIDARGANLPATIARLAKGEEREGSTYAALANRLADLIDDIRGLDVLDDERTETLTLRAMGRDGILHPARSLSDGTLRFLVLAASHLDPDFKGLICLEEPENGIHPPRIASMVRLLKDIAVDPDEQVGPDNPLRQVIINTHSPDVVRNVLPDELVFVDEAMVREGESSGRVVLIRVPEKSWRQRLDSDHPVVRRGQLLPYLEISLSDDASQYWMDFEADTASMG